MTMQGSRRAPIPTQGDSILHAPRWRIINAAGDDFGWISWLELVKIMRPIPGSASDETALDMDGKVLRVRLMDYDKKIVHVA